MRDLPLTLNVSLNADMKRKDDLPGSTTGNRNNDSHPNSLLTAIPRGNPIHNSLEVEALSHSVGHRRRQYQKGRVGCAGGRRIRCHHLSHLSSTSPNPSPDESEKINDKSTAVTDKNMTKEKQVDFQVVGASTGETVRRGRVSSNLYASGSNQNCGNVLTDIPTTKVSQPPGRSARLSDKCF